MDELNEEWEEKEQGREKAVEEEEEEEEEASWPPWLKPLLQTTFFTNCNFHGEPNNMYCLDCMNGSLCSSCLIPHRDHHHFIQIRRSSYHDVIRVSEIQKVLDISGVQTYVINGARVVFLNQRPQLRPAKAVSNTCRICDRSLLDSSYYCSLGCKITGTSGSHRRKQSPQRHSEAGDSSSGYRKVESATVPSSDSRREKRRKGTPHRAPMGCC